MQVSFRACTYLNSYYAMELQTSTVSYRACASLHCWANVCHNFDPEQPCAQCRLRFVILQHELMARMCNVVLTSNVSRVYSLLRSFDWQGYQAVTVILDCQSHWGWLWQSTYQVTQCTHADVVTILHVCAGPCICPQRTPFWRSTMADSCRSSRSCTKRAIRTSLRSLVSGMSTASLMTWLHRYCLPPLLSWIRTMWCFASSLCSSWSGKMEANDALVTVAKRVVKSLSLVQNLSTHGRVGKLTVKTCTSYRDLLRSLCTWLYVKTCVWWMHACWEW